MAETPASSRLGAGAEASATSTPAPAQAEVDDVRVRHVSPITSPALLLEELPSSGAVRKAVKKHRTEVESVLAGRDDRLLVLVGACRARPLHRLLTRRATQARAPCTTWRRATSTR